MFTLLTLGFLALLYVAVLFLIAHWGDRQTGIMGKPKWRGVVYSLSLAVYCSSWTFYGAVGSAVNNGWLYIAIYLGPVLLMIFGHHLFRQLLRVTKEQRITSIADFIAYRYGKGRGLAIFVTVAAVLGTLPYIALQLKAVTTALVISTQASPATGTQGAAGLAAGNIAPALSGSLAMQDLRGETALILALALALFAILFGARRLDASEHHRGLVLAVAFESLVKLLAFAAVGIWAWFAWLDGPQGLVSTILSHQHYRELFLPESMPDGFWVQTLLAAAAIFCLPRQFHVSFVENEQQQDLRMARWLFPLYLLLFSMLVIPIAVAGMERFAGQPVSGDTYVLSLPIVAGHKLLTLLSFLGGFSAATGMVIMATVALATMVSNDLVLPLVLKWGNYAPRTSRLGEAKPAWSSDWLSAENWEKKPDKHGNLDKMHPQDRTHNLGRLLLNTRRYTICGLSLIAWGYYLVIEESAALATLGLVSFAAAAQFGPLLVAGVYWRRASRGGAVLGLVGGFVSWLVLVALPPYLPEIWAGRAPDFSTAVWISLGMNCLGLVIGSWWSGHHRMPLPTILAAQGSGNISIRELRQLAAYFIGNQRVEEAFSNFMPAASQGTAAPWDAPADGSLIRFTERLLAGCIGSASARAVMTSGLRGQGMDSDEALRLLEQTSSAIQFNRELLEATLDSISQGVSVVDADLRLVSWNRAYLELLGYPPGVVYTGRPVEELILFNAQRGLCGPGEVQDQVDRRMYHMRRGTPYVFERVQPDGRVVEIRGSPMPQGGYVTTYTDVTPYKRTEQALRASEKRIHFYTDNAPALLAYVDRDMRYRFANRAYRELVGLADEDLDNRPVNRVLSPADLDQRSPYIRGVLAGHRQHFELAMPPLRNNKGERPEMGTSNKEERYALATYIPDVDQHGQVRGFFAVLQDISSRRRAELALQEAYATMEQQVEQRTRELRETMQALNLAKQDAEQANQSKTRFLAAASHDLLQPMNAARLFASVLAQSAGELPQEQARLVRRVDHSLAAAEELLSALLDITRLDQGALQPEFVVLQVNDLLEKIRLQFAELAQRRGLSFRVRPYDAYIRCDAQLLQRVLMNLVSNALRYTRQGGVLVACQKRGDRLQISVWDTGPGIADHEQSRIFLEFQRLENNSNEKGLGLGLAICQRIARMLDAPMGVRSRPGRGSCFYISLPLVRDVESSAEVADVEPLRQANLGGADFRGVQVLCLDDDREILEGMEALLERWGCHISLAQTMEEALELAQAYPPDLLIVDFYLGGGPDGLDVAAAVNAQFDRPRPVVVITADHSEQMAQRIRQNGHQMMSKPLRPAALKAIIRNLLRRP